MSHVSIIGGGNMGQAIATIVIKGGNTVEVFNSNDADKPVTGDVVFLAVPYPAVADVLAQRGDQLAGKVLVGITKNPLNIRDVRPACRSRGRLGRREERISATPAAGPEGLQYRCAGGLRTINAGSLARAREREAPGFLQITLAAAEKRAWTGGFAVA